MEEVDVRGREEKEKGEDGRRGREEREGEGESGRERARKRSGSVRHVKTSTWNENNRTYQGKERERKRTLNSKRRLSVSSTGSCRQMQQKMLLDIYLLLSPRIRMTHS